MYAAEVDGKRLNFAVSGMLWKRSLVMRDDETESLWSHILGKCMRGKLKGVELEVVPSLLTDWGSWKKLHPDTTAVVLSKTAQQFDNRFYEDKPERFVVGISLGKSARAWRFDHLKQKRVINDEWRSRPIVVSLHLPSYSSTIFSRKVDDQVLTFRLSEKTVVDEETGSTWDLQTGTAESGKLKGKKLRQLRSIPSFRKSWREFHPESSYWNPE